LPKLPEAAESLQSPVRPGKLLAGLEDSRGALYEIGVSDDGTFVGLTKDEMDESLTNLRAMAGTDFISFGFHAPKRFKLMLKLRSKSWLQGGSY